MHVKIPPSPPPGLLGVCLLRIDAYLRKYLRVVGMQPMQAATALPTSRYLSLCDRFNCHDLLSLAASKYERVLVLHEAMRRQCDGRRSLIKGAGEKGIVRDH